MRFRAWSILLVVLVGCGQPVARFTVNVSHIRKNESEDTRVSPQQKRDIATVLEAMFGTPDAPFLPTAGDTGIEMVVDASQLGLAAGAVSSDVLGRSTGLYRQHCAHCHGITGDGRGPTARFLNPYPRDYRKGQYKFKSTKIGSRPTHDDLKRVLINGIPGTAMPSFKLLPDIEVEALVNYVKFLSIRGEVERGLIEYTAQELEGPEDRILDPNNPSAVNEIAVSDILSSVVSRWREVVETPADHVVEVPKRPEMTDEAMVASVQRGKELFYGAVANCVKCHGESQLGDGQMTDYDEWTKDYFDWSQTGDMAVWNAKKAEYESGFRALPLRNILPRNLRQGVYRGGNRPIDIFWRIHNGIEGSPMPAAMLKTESAPAGLSTDDIWDIVNYVQSLPYEGTGDGMFATPENQRELR